MCRKRFRTGCVSRCFSPVDTSIAAGLLSRHAERIVAVVARRRLWPGRGGCARAGGPVAAPTGTRTISRAELEDRVRGGWAGQMIGVSFGAPTEFKSNGKIIEGDLPRVGTRQCVQRHRPGRSVRRDDLCRGDGSRRPRRDDRGVRRGVPHEQVQPVARQRRRAPAARNRHQGAVVGPPEVQRPRQRHRLPDRGRLHRPDDAGPAQRRAGLQHPRRPGDELRRRPLRRPVRDRACTRPPSSRPMCGASSRRGWR